ncbi:hypothetical protein HI113_00040 [Corallococcus exiguus]|uniref:hypothetical protein n=1 Tax=Corallococcus TaxID=83461 RepID=UPI000EC004CD|nr:MULTISPECIES: hypothetical protein [Corallococcus]NNB83957.1 hypothetical protein [Corallococcus exiguus]NNB92313.1 hypothetical protein [Corallococcus exiguus]NPC46091.1 hypothetical protein [Corallococcus exiguus]RKH86792.1 hypothetical protein D7X99_01960 [Corallococcus sp. AB032C]
MHAGATSTGPKPFPASGLLHPMVLVAVVLLVLNDHVFKARWPSWWTGKLSDVAGLAMFPVLLQALWEQAFQRRTREFRPSFRVLVGAVVLTGLCFGATKISSDAGDAWRWALGALQWPFYALRAWLGGARVPSVRPTVHTVDITDLLTLPSLIIPLWLGWRRARVAREQGVRIPAHEESSLPP